MTNEQRRFCDRQSRCCSTLGFRLMSAGRRFSQELPVRQFVGFCLVGGSGVFVDMTILHILAGSGTLHWNLVVSKICAAEVAMVNNFIWNDLWTFRGLARNRGGISPMLRRFGKFNLICSVGILMSAVFLKLLVYAVGMNLYLANLVAIVATTLWNFGMNYVFNWGRKPGERIGH